MHKQPLSSQITFTCHHDNCSRYTALYLSERVRVRSIVTAEEEEEDKQGAYNFFKLRRSMLSRYPPPSERIMEPPTTFRNCRHVGTISSLCVTLSTPLYPSSFSYNDLTFKPGLAETISTEGSANAQIDRTLRAISAAVVTVTILSASVANNSVHLDDQIVSEPIALIVAEKRRIIVDMNLL